MKIPAAPFILAAHAQILIIAQLITGQNAALSYKVDELTIHALKEKN